MKLTILLVCVVIAGTTAQDYKTLVSGASGVPDSALTASSEYDEGHGAHRARMNTTEVSPWVGGISASWSAKNKAAGEWIQVQFDKPKQVYAVQTKGRKIYEKSQYVSTYKVSYSKDCNVFTYYMENGVEKVFQGNDDRDTLVTNDLQTPVRALCLRIVVVTFEQHPSLRFDVLGTEDCWISRICDLEDMYEGSCYKTFLSPLNWADSQSDCQQQGGNLVSISNAAEMEHVSAVFLRQSERHAHVWIGLTNKEREGNFVWSDTYTTATYTNWRQGEPNGVGIEDCAAAYDNLNKDWLGLWNDMPCDVLTAHMCEFSQVQGGE